MPRRGRDKGQELIDLDSDAEDGEAFRHPAPPKSPLSLRCAALFRAMCCDARGALLDVLARWRCGWVGCCTAALRCGWSVGCLVPDSLLCAGLGVNAGFFFRLAEIERVRRCISPQILVYILSGRCCMSGTDYCVMVGLLEMYRVPGCASILSYTKPVILYMCCCRSFF